MNDSPKAVIIEVSGSNLRDRHIDLRGESGLFPSDCLGGSDRSAASHAIRLQLGSERVETDIDEGEAVFRERGAVHQSFEDERLAEGDLVLIERVGDRSYNVSKASKRGFNHYL